VAGFANSESTIVDIIHSSSEDSPPSRVDSSPERCADNLLLFFRHPVPDSRDSPQFFRRGVHRFACASEIAGAYVVRRAGPAVVYNRNRGFRENRRMKSDGTFYRAVRPFPGTFRHIREPSLLLSWPSLRVFAYSSPHAYMTEAKLETRDTRIDVGYLYLARMRIRAYRCARNRAVQPSLCRGNTNERRRVSRMHFRGENLCRSGKKEGSSEARQREREREREREKDGADASERFAL